MKQIVLAALLLMTFAIVTRAQDSRPVTQTDVDFHNRIGDAFRKALAENFRDWDAELPDKDIAPFAIGDMTDFCAGTTCWRTHTSKATYDGTQIKDDFYTTSQKEAQAIDASDPEYGKKVGLVLNKFTNATKLQVFIYANVTDVGTLKYCKPSGYQKLSPPSGWNSYLSSAGSTCFSMDNDSEQDYFDVSVFSMGVFPQVKEHKGESKLYLGDLTFPLNKALMKTYKVQNVVLVVVGSQKSALEYVKKMDSSVLTSLLK